MFHVATTVIELCALYSFRVLHSNSNDNNNLIMYKASTVTR